MQALRAQIRAIKKAKLAQEVYEQKLAEAQEVARITIEAGQKMGELLLTIQKDTSFHGNQHKEVTSERVEKTKTEITSEMGMTKDQVSEYQQMADNPEVVQATIQKAIENGDVVSRSQVMKEIRSYRAMLAEKDRKISELEQRKPEVVPPADYKKIKSKAKAYDAETERLNRKLEEAYRERNRLEEEIRELQEQTVRERANSDFIASATYFIAQCGSFIRDVGGYVWIADKIADLPENDRIGYVKAAMAVRDWATILLQNIERSDYGKQTLERIGEESK